MAANMHKSIIITQEDKLSELSTEQFLMKLFDKHDCNSDGRLSRF